MDIFDVDLTNSINIYTSSSSDVTYYINLDLLLGTFTFNN